MSYLFCTQFYHLIRYSNLKVKSQADTLQRFHILPAAIREVTIGLKMAQSPSLDFSRSQENTRSATGMPGGLWPPPQESTGKPVTHLASPSVRENSVM